MSIETIDISAKLPRLDRRQLERAVQQGGVPAMVEELSRRWNEAMQEIEDRLNEKIGEKINYLLTHVNTDFAYFGSKDQYGRWDDGTWRIQYDKESGELQIQRYLSSAWVNVHRFLRTS